ncbi:hypothetical protein V6N13_046262 [Hibiscus sabdariffa]|uniref:Uncharacterized protein n=1 Tax=Hibiscus sabdariffa TaxID=183260 RepID=A0ABR2D9Y9_9ROSI
MLPIPKILIHFRICRIRESLLRVGAFSNAQQPGEGWLPGDRLRQGPLGLLLMRLGEGIGKGLINQTGRLLGTRKRESGWRTWCGVACDDFLLACDRIDECEPREHTTVVVLPPGPGVESGGWSGSGTDSTERLCDVTVM